MKQNKFKVKIPNDDGTFIEKQFPTVKDIATFLNVGINTFNSLKSKRLKLIHENKKFLEGIVIEKIEVDYKGKNKKKEEIMKINEEKKKKYREDLKQKV